MADISRLVTIDAPRTTDKPSRLTLMLSVAIVGLGLTTAAFALVAGTVTNPDEPTSMVAFPL
jgi:hypothetical protein